MRIRYIIPLKHKILIDDHWPTPILGGTCRLLENEGETKALEITFDGQPVELSPKAESSDGGQKLLGISGRDTLMPVVKSHLDRSFAFLQCFFDIVLKTAEIEAFYEGESVEEEEQIAIKSMSKGKRARALPMTFDFITRSIMAAESGEGPEFISTLASAARSALIQELYIDSFRYSFLLIESEYGAGKFKSNQLKAALKSNADLAAIIEEALKAPTPSKKKYASDTKAMMSNNPNTDDVVDHIVDKRGFYFHGNSKQKKPWQPHLQDEAESLALIALDIVHGISAQAAMPMFVEELEQRHFLNAKQEGAIIVYEIDFKFREPDEGFDRSGQIRINGPGTKATPRTALKSAQAFLAQFESTAPLGKLKTATCVVHGTGEEVFEMRFPVAEK